METVDSVCNEFEHFWRTFFQKRRPLLKYTINPKKIFSKYHEISRESNEWVFDVEIRSLSKNVDDLELFLETSGISKLSVVR